MVRGWSYRGRIALMLALAAPLVVSALLLPLRHHLANTQLALILVLVVVGVAATGNRVAGIVTAIGAGVWFDFFFTRPYQRFTIADRSDIETFVLLLAVGIAATELAAWGRRQQALASREAGYLAGVHAAAAVGATGGSPSELIKNVSRELVGTLGLLGCHYQPGVAGRGNPPRLERDGRVTWNHSGWDVERVGLPGSTIELLVQNGGRLHGRFLLSAAPNTHTSLDQRLVAVTLADQVGAALG
jgi:pimeloyl-ACP methyl ester carboxylesterase